MSIMNIMLSVLVSLLTTAEPAASDNSTTADQWMSAGHKG